MDARRRRLERDALMDAEVGRQLASAAERRLGLVDEWPLIRLAGRSGNRVHIDALANSRTPETACGLGLPGKLERLSGRLTRHAAHCQRCSHSNTARFLCWFVLSARELSRVSEGIKRRYGVARAERPRHADIYTPTDEFFKRAPHEHIYIAGGEQLELFGGEP